MSRSALIFKCYQCDAKFASFEAQRTHELFVHGKFIENCNIDLEKQKKAYYEANKDKLKAYYEANKDKLKAYREANKDKLKAYREANKDKIAESKKAYYEANKDKIAESKKKNYVKSMRNFVK